MKFLSIFFVVGALSSWFAFGAVEPLEPSFVSPQEVHVNDGRPLSLKKWVNVDAGKWVIVRQIRNAKLHFCHAASPVPPHVSLCKFQISHHGAMEDMLV